MTYAETIHKTHGSIKSNKRADSIKLQFRGTVRLSDLDPYRAALDVWRAQPGGGN